MEKSENDDLEMKSLLNEKIMNAHLVECLYKELKDKLIELQNEFTKSYVIDDNEKVNENNMNSDDGEKITTLKYLLENQSKLINEFIDNYLPTIFMKKAKIFAKNKFFMDNIDREARLIIMHMKEKRRRLLKFKHHLQYHFKLISPPSLNDMAEYLSFSSSSHLYATVGPTTNAFVPTPVQTVQPFVMPPRPTATWNEVLRLINSTTILLRRFLRTEGATVVDALIDINQRMADLVEFVAETVE